MPRVFKGDCELIFLNNNLKQEQSQDKEEVVDLEIILLGPRGKRAREVDQVQGANRDSNSEERSQIKREKSNSESSNREEPASSESQPNAISTTANNRRQKSTSKTINNNNDLNVLKKMEQQYREGRAANVDVDYDDDDDNTFVDYIDYF